MFFLVAVIIVKTVIVQAQTDPLTTGNSYLNKGDFVGAEKVFKAGIKEEPDNAMLQCQLGLALVQQRKFEEADVILTKILTRDSLNVLGNWYSGISNYKNERYRKAIAHFERVLPHVDKRSGEFVSAHWFIAKSYGELLITDGISSSQADRMFECFDTYLTLQPNAPDSQQLRDYVTLKKKRRPETIEDVWIDY